MAQQNTTNFEGLLFQFMDSPDPMLSMLEWLNKEIRGEPGWSASS